MKYPINKTLKNIDNYKLMARLDAEIDEIYKKSILPTFPSEENIVSEADIHEPLQTVKISKNNFHSNIALNSCTHVIHVLTIKYKYLGHQQESKYYIIPNLLSIENIDYLTEICLNCLLGHLKL